MNGASMLASPIPLARGGLGNDGDNIFHSATDPSLCFTPCDPVSRGDAEQGQILWPLGLKEDAIRKVNLEAGLPADFGVACHSAVYASQERQTNAMPKVKNELLHRYTGNGDPLSNSGAPKLQAFVPAPAFAGSQPGYVFKMDAQGLGYYLDLDGDGVVREDLPGACELSSGAPLVQQQVQSQQQTTNLGSMTPEQQAMQMLKELLRTLPMSSDVLAQSKNVLQVLRELQMHATRYTSSGSCKPDNEAKIVLSEAIKWALQQVFDLSQHYPFHHALTAM